MKESRTMRKFIVIVALAGAVTACSPEQNQAWLRWFRQDPQKAAEWASEECGDLCSEDWDGDGVVEPEPSAEAVTPDTDSEQTSADTWSDVTGSESDSDIGWGQCSQWMGDALDAGWTTGQWETLNWIMARESGCDPGAYNPSGASGLLQLMPFWAGECGGSSSDLFSPWFNLSCGLHVYNVQGWNAWSVY